MPQRKNRTFSYIKAEGNRFKILKVIVSLKVRYTVFWHHVLTLILCMQDHVTLHRTFSRIFVLVLHRLHSTKQVACVMLTESSLLNELFI